MTTFKLKQGHIIGVVIIILVMQTQLDSFYTCQSRSAKIRTLVSSRDTSQVPVHYAKSIIPREQVLGQLHRN